MRWTFAAEADPAEQKWCQHAICRDDQERDLAFMASALNRKDLRALADAAHQSTVRCRLQPRKGAMRAPLPKSEFRERTFRAEHVQLCEIPLPPRRA